MLMCLILHFLVSDLPLVLHIFCRWFVTGFHFLLLAIVGVTYSCFPIGQSAGYLPLRRQGTWHVRHNDRSLGGEADAMGFIFKNR